MSTSDIRDDFALFRTKDPLIYFDNSATTQRPDCVIEAVNRFYREKNANPLRGLYDLAYSATEEYEEARRKTASFIGVSDSSQIVFTRNATESINLVAECIAGLPDAVLRIGKGDNIVITVSEHHSNILPWQRLASRSGADLVYIEPDMTGVITEEEITSKINDRTRLVAAAHVSNVWGCVNPIEKIISRAKTVGAVTVIDGAQAVAHMKVDVEKLGCDFYVFSGHKMMAPMGIGVLFGKRNLLEQMPPYVMGGEMIEFVTRESATFAKIPHKFEAGTVNAGGAVGLAAACDYISRIGFDRIRESEDVITSFLMQKMNEIEGVTIYGSSKPSEHSGIISFNIDGCHPHDVASILNEDHICVRAGHHCAQPLMQFMGIGSCVRASVYAYNTPEEADRFVKSLSKVRKVLGY